MGSVVDPAAQKKQKKQNKMDVSVAGMRWFVCFKRKEQISP